MTKTNNGMDSILKVILDRINWINWISFDRFPEENDQIQSPSANGKTPTHCLVFKQSSLLIDSAATVFFAAKRIWKDHFHLESDPNKNIPKNPACQGEAFSEVWRAKAKRSEDW